MAIRMSWLLLVLAGCTQIPRPFGPLLECGTFYPDQVAHQAGCSVEIRYEEVGEVDKLVSIGRYEFNERGQKVLHDFIDPITESRSAVESWEWDAHGELMRHQMFQGESSWIVGDVEYEHDERGMVLRSQSNVNPTVEEYDVSSDECTWSEYRLFRDDILLSVGRAIWWEERPEIVQIGDSTEERYSYDDRGRKVRYESWPNFEWSRSVDYVYDEHDEVSFARYTHREDTEIQSFPDDYEVRWERDEEGRVVDYVSTFPDEDYRVQTSWQGPYEAVRETFSGTRLTNRETWSWDCPGG